MALVTPKALFIHVPKTGGTFVRAALQASGIPCRETGPFEVEDHYGIDEVRAAHPDDLVGRLSFGFVRHPVTWLKSRWAWGVLSGFASAMQTNPAAARHWMASCWSNDFSEFVEQTLERQPGIAGRTMLAMLGWWTNPVDRIGKYESLEADLLAIFAGIGQPLNIDLRNLPRETVGASGRLAMSCDIKPALERRIMQSERRLSGLFGY